MLPLTSSNGQLLVVSYLLPYTVTYFGNYVGKQASSNCKDAVHFGIVLLQKDPVRADVCAFVSMKSLMA